MVVKQKDGSFIVKYTITGFDDYIINDIKEERVAVQINKAFRAAYKFGYNQGIEDSIRNMTSQIEKIKILKS